MSNSPRLANKSGTNDRISNAKPKEESVKVSVRVRPLSLEEMSSKQAHVWSVVPGQYGIICMQPEWREKWKKMAVEYQYDNVYAGSSNIEVYLDSVSEVVRSSMQGYNGTVFAYGQTSSGKTYTMMGNEQNPGVIPRAIADVFDYISETKDQREFLLRVSYIEIYNESIKDLLTPENKDLKIREGVKGEVYVTPLREDIVTTPEQVFETINKGEENRHVSSTDYNESSSRSHTIFQLTIESRDRKSADISSDLQETRVTQSDPLHNTGPVRISTLNLIDLAGSEKASSSVERRREGSYINKSLLTLGTVISKLTDAKAGHVPYRDSKLTRILQTSLQGNARVSVICTITPAAANQEESTNTLKFAKRIKKVVTRAAVKEVIDENAMLQQYRLEIDELRTKLSELSDRENTSSHLAAEKLRLEEELQQQQLVRVALKERIDHLTKLILTSSSLSTKGSNYPLSPTSNHNHHRPRSTSNEEHSYPPADTGFRRVPSFSKSNETESNLLQSLRKTIREKDEYISRLLDQLNSNKNPEPESSSQKKFVSLDKYHDVLRELNIARDKISDLESENRKLNYQVSDYEMKIVELSANSMTLCSPDSLNERTSSLENNQQNLISDSSILKSLLKKHSETDIQPFTAKVATSSGESYPSTSTTSNPQYQAEKTMRKKLQEDASDRIAQLETELSMAKAEIKAKNSIRKYNSGGTAQLLAQVNQTRTREHPGVEKKKRESNTKN